MTNLSAEEQEYRSRCLAYNISNGTSLTVEEFLRMTVDNLKFADKLQNKQSNRNVSLDNAVNNKIKRRL
jgi:hypothetical protein